MIKLDEYKYAVLKRQSLREENREKYLIQLGEMQRYKCYSGGYSRRRNRKR